MGTTEWKTSTPTPESRYGFNSAGTGLVNSVWSGRVETDTIFHANWATPQAYFASPLGENPSPQHLTNNSDIREERKYANAGTKKTIGMTGCLVNSLQLAKNRWRMPFPIVRT